MALGVVKLAYGFTTGFRMIISPPGTATGAGALRDFLAVHSREVAFAVILFYAVSAAFCFATGVGVHRRMRIAIVLGSIYATIQLVGIAFVSWIGFVAFVNAAFGMMALISLWLARTFEAEHPPT